MVEHGAVVPSEAHFFFSANVNCASIVGELAQRGVYHPEFLLEEENFVNLERMLSTSTSVDDSKTVTFGIVSMMSFVYATLGTVVNQETVSKFVSIVENNSRHFPIGPLNDVFDDIRRKLTSAPSSLKVISRGAVRRQLLSNRHYCYLSRIVSDSFVTSIPKELRQFLLFSDLDISTIWSFSERNYAGAFN